MFIMVKVGQDRLKLPNAVNEKYNYKPASGDTSQQKQHGRGGEIAVSSRCVVHRALG